VFFETLIDADPAQWYPLEVRPLGAALDGTADVTQASVPGIWRVDVSGLGLVRCRLGGTVLGAITVKGIGTTVSGE
jgi:hypothetical protein